MVNKNGLIPEPSSNNTTQNPPLITDPDNQAWKKRGEDDVNFQRQAQVTWWTLLGGIAVGALLTQMESLLLAVKAGQWYYLLYFFATCFVIIYSWMLNAWGALVQRVPITVPKSVYIFFSGLSLSIAALNITRPAIWAAAIITNVLFGILIALLHRRQKAWIAFPKEATHRTKHSMHVYIAFIIIGVVGDVILFLFPSVLIESIWGFIALTASLFALYWQHVGMQLEKKGMGIV